MCGGSKTVYDTTDNRPQTDLPDGRSLTLSATLLAQRQSLLNRIEAYSGERLAALIQM